MPLGNVVNTLGHIKYNEKVYNAWVGDKEWVTSSLADAVAYLILINVKLVDDDYNQICTFWELPNNGCSDGLQVAATRRVLAEINKTNNTEDTWYCV